MTKAKTSPPRKRGVGVRLFEDQLERIDKLIIEKYRGRIDRSGFVRLAIDEKLARIDKGEE